MKGDRKAWHYSKVGCLLTLNGGTGPVLIQCCADTWQYEIFVDHQYWKAVPRRCCTDAWHYSKVGCLPTLNVRTAPVLIQCCTDAWQYTNVGCFPALKSSTAPVFSQCRPSDVPTLGTVLIGSTGIIHGLQPERYRAGCKDWQYTDFSAWVLKSYWNVYRKSSAKRERHGKNVFLKADRALSKLNFLFHLNSKRNWVTLRKLGQK